MAEGVHFSESGVTYDIGLRFVKAANLDKGMKWVKAFEREIEKLGKKASYAKEEIEKLDYYASNEYKKLKDKVIKIEKAKHAALLAEVRKFNAENDALLSAANAKIESRMVKNAIIRKARYKKQIADTIDLRSKEDAEILKSEEKKKKAEEKYHENINRIRDANRIREWRKKKADWARTEGGTKKHISARKRELQNFGRYVQHWAARVALFVGVGFVARGIKNFTFGIIEQAREMDRLAKITGINIEALSGFKYAAEVNLITVDQFKVAVDFLNKAMYEATTRGGDAKEAFENLGISVKEVKNLNTEQAFYRVADGMKQTTNATIKANAALAIFGRGGRNMLAITDKGSEGLREYLAVAGEMGNIFTQELADNARELGKSMKAVSAGVTGLGMSFMKDFAPAMKDYIDFLRYDVIPILKTAMEYHIKTQNEQVLDNILKKRKELEKFGAKAGSTFQNFLGLGEIWGMAEKQAYEELLLLLEQEGIITKENSKWYKDRMKAAQEAKEKEKKRLEEKLRKEKEFAKWKEETDAKIDSQAKSFSDKAVERYRMQKESLDGLNESLEKNLDLELEKDPDKLPSWTPPTPDPSTMETSREYRETTNNYKDLASMLVSIVRDALSDMEAAFSEFFYVQMEAGVNFKDAWKELWEDMKRAALKALSDIMAKAITVSLVLQASGGMASFDKGGFVPKGPGSLPKIPKAEKGMITRGTGPIPAILHPNEVVLPANWIGDFFKTTAERMFKGVPMPSGGGGTSISNSSRSYSPVINVTVNSPDLNDDIQLLNIARKIGDKLEQDQRRRVN